MVPIRQCHKDKNEIYDDHCRKDECLRVIPNIYTECTYMTEKTSDKKQSTIPLSGNVILMIATEPSSNDNNRPDIVWQNESYDKVKKCKLNVLQSYDHHSLKSACFLFGNKPLYGMIDNSSVEV